ncbi:MAG: DNA polymerase/3'-5' exonuclease PolX [Bacteroidetes bacterium]|nr:DNA polymerase/3'-5' exonuclease PolX [Bacteroidota bacterium]
MENLEIGEIFALYGKLLELHGENEFRAANYLNAPFKFKKLSERLADLNEEQILSHPALSKSLVSKIPEVLHRGSFTELDEIISQTPSGLIELMSVRGLGAKKIRELWTKLGIESPGELLYACKENRLISLKGFGEKSQQNIVKELEFRELNLGKILFSALQPTAAQLFDFISNLACISRVEYSGAYRRLCEIISKLEFVVVCNNLEQLKQELSGLGLQIKEESPSQLNYELKPGFEFVLHIANANNFASTLFRTSASAAHLSKITMIREHASTEEEIYQENGLHFIRPELREGLNEIELARQGIIPEAVSYSDVKGVLHNHTLWSDGRNTVREMAEFCIAKGWEYIAICDHSQTAAYAGGLSIDRVLQQFNEIDKLNVELAPFKIFKGIESDILGDGSLDYPTEILAQFDLVVASVHSNLNMDEERAMQRLTAAIENPYTTILGHPTGRLLLSRKGYPVNHKELIDICAANQVVIELNANPHRLDIDWRWIAYAVTKGVKISINPDAHNLKGLLDMQFGVNVARKANLQKDFVLNALPLNEFERFLKDLRQSKGL